MGEVGRDEPHHGRCISSGGSRESGQYRERLEPGVAGESKLACVQSLPGRGMGIVAGQYQGDRSAGVYQYIGLTRQTGTAELALIGEPELAHSVVTDRWLGRGGNDKAAVDLLEF